MLQARSRVCRAFVRSIIASLPSAAACCPTHGPVPMLQSSASWLSWPFGGWRDGTRTGGSFSLSKSPPMGPAANYLLADRKVCLTCKVFASTQNPLKTGH